MRKKKIPHIQIDAHPIVDDHFSGVGHYTLGIIRGLDELAGEGKITYSLITPRKRSRKVAKYNLENYKKVVELPIPRRIMNGLMRYHWKVPMDLLMGRGSYYFPSFLNWPLAKSSSSVVIHDVSFLAVPECSDEVNRKYLKSTMPFSIKNTSNVITISNFSKSEIIKYYNYDKNKISVALPSIDRKHFYKRSSEEIHRVKAKYDIFSDKYILSVGNVEPRKNYSRLIDAYVKLPKKITDKYPLVIVGAGGWNNKDILNKIQKAKENGFKIINPKQFVIDDDMPALYSGAQFFIFVPIYEGFGMSPPEAYACGTPVIASRVASVPEAAGEAAVYVDPTKTEDILEKLKYMVKETERDRSQWDDKMKKHLNTLSWRVSAEITAAAITGFPVEHFQANNKEEQ